MPTEIQIVMTLLLTNFREQKQLNDFRENLKVIDEAELQLNSRSCKLAKQWLCFEMTFTRVAPINKNCNEQHKRLDQQIPKWDFF